MRPLRAGDLRHRITIEENVGTTDEMGQVVDSWQSFTERWAAIEPLQQQSSPEELQFAGVTVGDATHWIRLRTIAGITPAMRVTYGDRVFQIQGVTDTETRGVETRLIVKERV